MRKTLLIALFCLSIGTLSAQEVGIRVGNVIRNNAAIDMVFGTGNSRIHADVSFGNNGVGVEVLWDLLYRPIGGEAFHWYIGVGPAVSIDDPFYLGVSGEIGLEYRFNTVPIVLGVDYRPTFWVIEDTDFSARGFGLNVRWNFGD